MICRSVTTPSVALGPITGADRRWLCALRGLLVVQLLWGMAMVMSIWFAAVGFPVLWLGHSMWVRSGALLRGRVTRDALLVVQNVCAASIWLIVLIAALRTKVDPTILNLSAQTYVVAAIAVHVKSAYLADGRRGPVSRAG